MGNETFSYQLNKNGNVRISWEGRCVMALGGKRADKLAQALANVEDNAEVQRHLQRVTGNFKRGNERP